MKITFTKHALLKIEQRRLTKEVVVIALTTPDFVLPSHSNRERAYKKIDKNYLEVVFVTEKNAIVVLTAHWVAKIKKLK